MLIAERHNYILELLDKKGAVRTMDLAKQLSVTDETIRRDLEVLNETGKVVRTHGGAISTGHPMKELTLDERENINMDDKWAIAEKAAAMIEPNDIIYMDSSSTVLQMIKYMPGFQFTVVTNAHMVINALIDEKNVNVIAAGGNFDRATRSYTGNSVLETLKRFNIKKAFCSGNGIDADRGLSEVYEEQARLKDEIIPMAEETYILMDHAKINKRSLYFFSSLSDVTAVITDSKSDNDDINDLREKTDVVIV